MQGDIVNLLSDYEQDRRPLAVRSHEYKQVGASRARASFQIEIAASVSFWHCMGVGLLPLGRSFADRKICRAVDMQMCMYPMSIIEAAVC